MGVKDANTFIGDGFEGVCVSLSITCISFFEDSPVRSVRFGKVSVVDDEW